MGVLVAKTIVSHCFSKNPGDKNGGFSGKNDNFSLLSVKNRGVFVNSALISALSTEIPI